MGVTARDPVIQIETILTKTAPTVVHGKVRGSKGFKSRLETTALEPIRRPERISSRLISQRTISPP